MPKRTDIQSIMIIGSGPIVIGQGCEFDYSGVQACKALRAQGYRIILVNSNPATIMTDPEFADATYIEPLTPEICEQIIAVEKPDALLPTVGGQTALNLALALSERGVLERHNVELIGASMTSIQLAEDRQLFKDAMTEIGLKSPASEVVKSVPDALRAAATIGYPVLVRPSFTLGGSGGGVAYTPDELRQIAERGLQASPVHSVLIDYSLIGWKEYELEVMRDAIGNFVIVCTIENLDPMGVHTGDSITVAPAQTLTDKEVQRLRDMARMIFDKVGLATGGANVQFAIGPDDGDVYVIEMNPRVSRSSALASKATGFPIAKIAALVAVGYTLDEISNDITRVTPASFEPSLDYVIVKIPRWDFEKFEGADTVLGPQMKAVGEVMAIGRTFPEALQKAVRALDIKIDGFGSKLDHVPSTALHVPTARRLFQVAAALMDGASSDEVIAQTQFDPWFVRQMVDSIGLHQSLKARGATLDSLTADDFRQLKTMGFADSYIAQIVGATERGVRDRRKALGVAANFYRVDTCAAEFEAHTPYLYSTYEADDEAFPTDRRKVVVLGGGPNRIGQGIEFDYCCVHACFALSEMGFETIMVNCNPETVSTDYDTADRLYFEPLTAEDVLNIIDREKPDGVLVQFGGQTPLNIAGKLADAGAPIWGTSVDTIDLAEDRKRFNKLMADLDITQPPGATASSIEEALAAANQIGYPVLVRPSYVLGGRGMGIVFDDVSLVDWLERHITWGEHPVLIDQFLDDAFEVDVDALCDGQNVIIGGIMQHIEEAGVHSGDSACVLPPYKISQYHLEIIRDDTRRIGLALGVRGCFNIQFAVKDDVVYVLEVNPRASRTVPFVSKATGRPLARYAAMIAAGKTLEEIGFTEEPHVDGFFVKEAVLPFQKFPGVDARLGPEMRSTGEVMGHASNFGHAFVKAQMSTNVSLPQSGTVMISVNDYDKGAGAKIARDLHLLGFKLMATEGTANYLKHVGLPVERVNKISDGSPHVVDMMTAGRIDLLINTPLGGQAHEEGAVIRAAAVSLNIPIITTMSAAAASVQGMKALKSKPLKVRSLQRHHHPV
ncbi:MAG: carbamoyl-phosphate synthase large subunit [Chloroflexi bacterium]|nr:carbamoyl-phosphate synthase large subunit [Chloroflexota bacterium]MCO6444250.1 carbamoyl-phosphate synthase large subunit [Anaerolineae bacterium]MDL1916223.1 carbamoyl-phosphate synthase large subunit [Anaerolineae bacterium CFX4]OQY81731.1 MAG: carbamoyl phosphate synthase large subunit [Anaerolineae bacterium UTCFX5]MCC6566127.1 carbamoyl-phosphate synthase large subunit [Chloroflexota bacterium]